MKIGFSGHRNKTCDLNLLADLLWAYPNAVWGHGNAKDGFDRQVDNFILRHRIPCVRFSPNPLEPGQSAYVNALLARNRELVDWLDGKDDFLVLLWDGRTSGGTYYTREYAISKKVSRIEWKP